MPKYSVDMVYTATVTYSGNVEVEAKDEEEAEDIALKAAKENSLRGWDSDEDSGDFEVENVELIEEDD